jgi:hypothetical protein
MYGFGKQKSPSQGDASRRMHPYPFPDMTVQSDP